MLWRFVTILSVLYLSAGCGGQSIEVSPLSNFRYYLESEFTGKGENFLVVEGPGTELLSYRLSGEGFEAEIPLESELPVKPKTKINFIEVGDYSMNVTFFKPDGTPLLEDRLKWRFSLESPANPIVGFTEFATNDAFTVLLVSESRDPGTNDIWIEGDIAPEEKPEGSWREIPRTSKIPLKLSEADGLKTIKVRLRNKYKNETEFRSLQIRKKSTTPQNCKAEIRGPGTNVRIFSLRLTGNNDGPMYYRVFGDVDDPSTFKEFKDKDKVDIILSKGYADKKFTVQIRDEADNYCLKQEFVVPFEREYEPEAVAIKGGALWTDNNVVTILPRIDSFADDTVEMLVHGDIVDDASTFEWVPYQPETQVTLTPNNGHRWIRVQFRINGLLTSVRYAGIYLKPFVYVQGISIPYYLVVSNIIGLDRLTITGCLEMYEVVLFQASFNCTPASTSVQVRYFLKDGTVVTRSAPFPFP
jgi:hypothetical protein